MIESSLVVGNKSLDNFLLLFSHGVEGELRRPARQWAGYAATKRFAVNGSNRTRMGLSATFTIKHIIF